MFIEVMYGSIFWFFWSITYLMNRILVLLVKYLSNTDQTWFCGIWIISINNYAAKMMFLLVFGNYLKFFIYDLTKKNDFSFTRIKYRSRLILKCLTNILSELYLLSLCFCSFLSIISSFWYPIWQKFWNNLLIDKNTGKNLILGIN